jgi:hypothetical protein
MTHDGHDEKRQPQNANKLETQPKPKLLTKASKHTPRLLTKAIKPTRFTAKGASARHAKNANKSKLQHRPSYNLKQAHM